MSKTMITEAPHKIWKKKKKTPTKKQRAAFKKRKAAAAAATDAAMTLPVMHRKKLYYSIYGGWHLDDNDCPILFEKPSHALAWSITRLIRDGMDIDLSPYFLSFIGLVEVHPLSLVKVSLSSSSKIERNYFAGISMYRVDTELLPCWTMQTESKYMKCKDSIVGEVKASLKPKADYQLSAISTYKPKKSCPQSSQDDLVTERSFLIDSFKRKGSVFIQMQTNCSKLKDNKDFDKG